ncbi:MAG: cupin domain-containing protein [Parvibaculaceae bacterium]
MSETAKGETDPQTLIDLLGLQPHPEGGHFRETFRDAPQGSGGRGHSTAIYYLLRAGERSHWHRVDAAEVWHFYAGSPLRLSIAADGTAMPDDIRLGPDVADGERPQAIVPAGAWQAAEPLGPWTLVGCTVAPGFDFSGFELAPPDWMPGAG